MSLRCAYHRRSIKLGFVNLGLAATRTVRLFRHLKRCVPCRGHYDRLMITERMVQHGVESSHLPSNLEVALWSPVVLQRLGAPTSAAESGQRAWGWRFGLAAAAVCILVVAGLFVFSDVMKDESRGTFAVREQGSPALAVRAFCEFIDDSGKRQVRSLSRDPAPQESSSCRADGLVRFAFLSKEAGNLYVLARFPDGGFTWLSDREKPPRIESASVLKALDAKLDPGFAGDFESLEVIFVLAQDTGLAASIEECLTRGDWKKKVKTLPGAQVVREVVYERRK